jgi:hypothetical protein
MVLAIVGSCVLLGTVAFLEWKKQRPLWHWVFLAISMSALVALLVLWVGEYRFENQQLLR